MSGGDRIAKALVRHGVRHLFTLCGGHISPILVSAKQRGISVIDVRHEATAVFAADAVSRLTGIPGVAAVTAGPGVTNTITAIKNAQLAQSALVLLGGATATFLKGRGALQDIDQMSLIKPHVKWAISVKTLREVVPAINRAFTEAKSGLPGPVFVELPVDLLYDEQLVRQWYADAMGKGKARGLGDKFVKWHLQRHVDKLFAGSEPVEDSAPKEIERRFADLAEVDQVLTRLKKAERPVLLIGSQAMLCACEMYDVAAAVEKLGVPVYLAGMARGLLGEKNQLQAIHKRSQALNEADLVLLAGVPMDFRLNYGRAINRQAKLITVNLSRSDLKKNRRPTQGIHADPGLFIIQLANQFPADQKNWRDWVERLNQRGREREKEIEAFADQKTDRINPLRLCLEINQTMNRQSTVVVDGGDFVATASYIVRPRGPFSWLDPGVFGTLGVGAGFALGAKLVKPESEVWLLYGDGSLGYGLAEFDTFVRHGLPVIAVVGNDAGWTQITREQVEILEDDVGTTLQYTDYHRAAEGLGAVGLLLTEQTSIRQVLQQAKELASAGMPVLINAHIGKTDFRKGSISM